MDYQVKFKKQQGGFSLLEILIVAGIVALVISISDSVYSNFRSHNNLELATYSVVEGARHAQENSVKVKEDSSWGVEILSDQIVVFKGNSYGSRDSSFDLALMFPRGVTATGLSEIVFEKVTGVTGDTGTTTLTGTDSTREIYINEKGTITY